jgi:prefoldin subunit 5
MANTRPRLAHLELLDDHLAELQARISSLQAQIAQLQTEDEETGQATEFLKILITTLGMVQQHKNLVEGTLNEPKPDQDAGRTRVGGGRR